jgi:hypothetical protein
MAFMQPVRSVRRGERGERDPNRRGIGGRVAAAMSAYQWADWSAFAQRLPGFIEWAEPAPTDLSEERYAIVRDGAIAWARVSPNPDVRVDLSSGRFYDTDDPNDHPEGAIEWCRNAARAHKEHVRKLIARRR